ncbi:putative chromatin remodeling & transcriptional activation CHROMO-DOMAIN family [Lupinus albus]|uniref:Putative chromatin remodeling & transcriptional activation CHROMO-DOMAIN family n=1 Tax=Lupinus albus TaxID=3870 RepID=A0A6A4PQ71_LUPAL|nr:putative chromatin remodeling & transcriptional activation CHROMO-DOMAIN family [Lupinus albus]
MKSVAVKKTTSEESNGVSASAAIPVGDVAIGGEFVAVGGGADVAMCGGEFGAVGGSDGGDVAVGVAEFVGGGVEKENNQNKGREDYEEEEKHDDDDDGNKLPHLSADSELYPVQAIRRKRVIKGQVQYLVKWLGWAESANTWEPPEHLTNVRDMIEAFEQSLASAKQRKPKRTSVSSHSQTKKRQERSDTPYSLRRIRNANADKHTQSAPPNVANITDPCAFPQAVLFADELEHNGDPSSSGKAKLSNGSGSTNPPELSKSNEENEYDPKLIELKAASTSGHGTADRLVTQVQEGNVAADNGQVDGRLKGVNVEQDQSDNSKGVKRKKSCSAKNSKEDSHAGESSSAEQPIDIPASTSEPVRAAVSDFVWHKSQKKKKKVLAAPAPAPAPVSNITKIIKSLGCSPTVSGDLCVTFIALRWDGMEVMVDNRYLKSHYPDLLIDFYENRINCNTP